MSPTEHNHGTSEHQKRGRTGRKTTSLSTAAAVAAAAVARTRRMGESCIVGFEKMHEGCVVKNSWLRVPPFMQPGIPRHRHDVRFTPATVVARVMEAIRTGLRCMGSVFHLFFAIEGMNLCEWSRNRELRTRSRWVGQHCDFGSMDVQVV